MTVVLEKLLIVEKRLTSDEICKNFEIEHYEQNLREHQTESRIENGTYLRQVEMRIEYEIIK